MNFRIPRSIRLLGQFGADALKPCLYQGRYIKPMISKRVAADLRKRSIIEGTFGSFVQNEGGWDPAWDLPRNMFIIKPNKGHLRERTRESRAKKITSAMNEMPKKIKKYEDEMQARKPVKDLFYMVKRAEEIARKRYGGLR